MGPDVVATATSEFMDVGVTDESEIMDKAYSGKSDKHR